MSEKPVTTKAEAGKVVKDMRLIGSVLSENQQCLLKFFQTPIRSCDPVGGAWNLYSLPTDLPRFGQGRCAVRIWP